VILRTAGAARTKQEVKRDFEYLLRQWELVRDLTLKSTAPTLVYEEGSLSKRSIRDLYSKDIDEIVVAAARKTLLGRLFTGSVVNELIAASPVPVTVVAGRQPSALQRFGLPAGVGVSLAALVMAID